MRFRTEKQQQEELVELLEGFRSDAGPVPRSALKDFRGSMTQTELASQSGVPQEMISLVEANRRNLTDDMAGKLAGPLDTDVGTLKMAHQISGLKDKAIKGRVEPGSLMAAIEQLSVDLPDGEYSDRMVRALLEILGDAVKAHQKQQKAPAKAATKSAAPPSTRDGTGRRRNKPYARQD